MTKSRRRLPALLLAVCLAVSLAGCKQAVLDGFNRFVEAGGVLQLTPDRELTGRRRTGADSYTGRYEADYDRYTGTEKLFGGSSIDREAGWEVEVQAVIETRDGQGRLLWTSGAGEPVVLLEGDGRWEGPLTFAPGSDVISFEGETFTGTLTLEVR